MEVLSFKKLIDKFRIVIPRLQRDYAYGRVTDEVENKRNALLKKLKKIFKEQESKELDLIYGSVKNGELIVLDGQQRITTLFLLHWYLSLVKDNSDNIHFDDFKNMMLKQDDESRFSYQTRESSRAFCNILVSLKTRDDDATSTIPIDHSKKYADIVNSTDKKKISDTMKKEKWFLPNWNYDPTVVGMLKMLDDIQELFPAGDCKDHYEKLTDDNNPKIVFNFLNLDDYHLTDDLYIKMNSRGRPLTKLENIKSRILPLYNEAKNLKRYQEQLDRLNASFGTEKFKTLREGVTYLFDLTWTDAFWKQFMKEEEKNRIDDMMLSFIAVMAINDHIINHNDSEEKFTDDIERLMKSRDEKLGITISYEDFDKIFRGNDYSFLFNMIDYLNMFVGFGGYKTPYILKLAYSEFNQQEEFRFLAQDYKNPNKMNFDRKLKLFAFVRYLREFPDADDEKLRKWMKFVINVIDNSNGIDNTKAYCGAMAGIDSLCCEDIEEKLKNGYPDKIPYLDNEQIKQENIKFKLSKNEAWKEALDNAEKKLQYFEGNLNFPLIYCCCVDETNINDSNALNKFKEYVEKLSAIFPNEKGCEFESHLIRAVLSKGNYLMYFKSNHSLLKNADRDNSWRRYLKEKYEVKEKIEHPIYEKDGDDYIDTREYFKQVLDDVDFDADSVKASLNKIAKNNKSSISLWRQLIIDNAAVLDGYEDADGNTVSPLGADRYMRWHNHLGGDPSNDDNYEIVLFVKKALHGEHSELFSLCKYLELKDEPTLKNNGNLRYETSMSQNKQPYFSYIYNDASGNERIIKVYYQGENKFKFMAADDGTISGGIASERVLTELSNQAK